MVALRIGFNDAPAQRCFAFYLRRCHIYRDFFQLFEVYSQFSDGCTPRIFDDEKQFTKIFFAAFAKVGEVFA